MTKQDQEYIAYYRTMITIRQFETMAGELFADGKIPGFIHLSIGQEAPAVGVCSCLRQDDYLTTTHRGHGHMIAKGADLKKMVAELFGKKTGYCKGKGGSMHIADFSIGILGANGVVAGGLPIIAGAGFSIKMRHATREAVKRARQGDGPTLIENKTYRIKGHFEGDPQKYRVEEEVQRWQDQKDPVMFFQHKKLFAKEGLVPEGDLTIPLEQAVVKRQGQAITLICYGSGYYLCEAAAQELGGIKIEAEIVDLRTLKPLDMQTVAGSIKKTSRAVIVHEACLTGGFGAELAARMQEELFDYLKAPIKRVAAKDIPIPFSPPLEDYALPKVSDVVEAARPTIFR